MTNARRLALLPLVALLAVPWVPAAQAQTTGAVAAGDDFKFTPATVRVAVGGKVTWTNTGSAPHTVTGGTSGNPDAASPVGDGQLTAQGQTYEVTFTAAGTYDYYCTPHASLGMVGQVVVGGGAAATTAPTTSPSPVAPSPSATPSTSGTPVAGPAGDGDPKATETPFIVPGIEGNAVLDDIKRRREEEEKTTSGFIALMGGATAAMVALCAALFASTRRRSG